jgi:hypothetical protein
VVRDRDQDRDRLVDDLVEHLLAALGEQRVDQEQRVTGVDRKAGYLGSPAAGVPFGMPRRPAPESVGELLH